MKTSLTLVALAATLALSACKQNTIVENGPPDPMANELANAAPVELPPAISASKSYRCADNSVVYIDWLSNGAARIKKSAEDVPGTEIDAAAAKAIGDDKAATIKYQGKSCKA
ncbi:hypothetical protein GCM10022281_04040 [Sphingomonas rosea]|jgi:hypothetical protein|uniref:DUF4156 domain-containing protein n=1 Tax=Sphingomonas rosea TaxID=335605 RepID=A0ABP7TMH2_9SPHN